MDSVDRLDAAGRLAPAALEQYRRDGYLVVRGLLAPDHVAACIDALAALADDPTVPTGSIPGDAPFIALEPTAAGADGAAHWRREALASGRRLFSRRRSRPRVRRLDRARSGRRRERLHAGDPRLAA